MEKSCKTCMNAKICNNDDQLLADGICYCQECLDYCSSCSRDFNMYRFNGQTLDENEDVDKLEEPEIDNINTPRHYMSHPSGIECIQIVEHMDFLLGNAIKYLWRQGLKDSTSSTEDLEKAIWYINRKIKLIKVGGSDD